MHQIELKFYPNQWNPARNPTFGVYRVMACEPCGAAEVHSPAVVIDTAKGPRMLMLAHRPYKVRSRVDPVRVAFATRAAM